jgi:hypothetical protein
LYLNYSAYEQDFFTFGKIMLLTIENPFTAFFAQVGVDGVLIYFFKHSIQFITRSHEVGTVIGAELDGGTPNGEESTQGVDEARGIHGFNQLYMDRPYGEAGKNYGPLFTLSSSSPGSPSCNLPRCNVFLFIG